MPQKKKSDAELKRMVDNAVDNMKEYLKVDYKEAVDALSKNLPEPEEKTENIVPYTQSPAVNQAIATAWSWGRTGYSLFSSGVEYAQKNIIHNEALKQEREALVRECLEELESDTQIDHADAIEKIKLLLVANMGLSLKHLGRDHIHSGDLYRRLCKSLEVSTDTEADRLCSEYSTKPDAKATIS